MKEKKKVIIYGLGKEFMLFKSYIPGGKVLLDAGAREQRYKLFCNHLKYIAQDLGKYIPNEVTTGL